MDSSHFGKVLLILGGVIMLMGALMLLGGKILWLGRLPGDVHIKKENFEFHFPIVTCLLVSAILTLLFWFFGRGK
jgi:membrane protein implicated in regulation of membrane protease activity